MTLCHIRWTHLILSPGFDLHVTDGGTWGLRLVLELVGTQVLWVPSVDWRPRSALLLHLLGGGAGHWEVVGSSSPFARQEQKSDLPQLCLTPFTAGEWLVKLMQPDVPLSGLKLRNPCFCVFTNTPTIAWLLIFWNTGLKTLRDDFSVMEAFLMVSWMTFPHTSLANELKNKIPYVHSTSAFHSIALCANHSMLLSSWIQGLHWLVLVKSHLTGWFPASELVIFHRNSPETCHEHYSVALAEGVGLHSDVFHHLDKDRLGFYPL